jgi:hypothetical protein
MRNKLATNWTLSGNVIEGGVRISGAPSLCGKCGSEMPPYVDDFCTSCSN